MDNGVVVLDMKSRNNANSPHSPAVTMTTEPPEVGGKSQEMEAEGRRGEAGQEGCMRPVFFVFFYPTVWQVLHIFLRCTTKTSKHCCAKASHLPGEVAKLNLRGNREAWKTGKNSIS